MSSTDNDSTIYDIIFVGGTVLSSFILSNLPRLSWQSGQVGLLLVSLQAVLPRLILPWRFWWVSTKFTPSVFIWFQVIQIVEAGPHTHDAPNHVQPGRYFSSLLRPTETFTFHVAKPSPALRDRSVIVSTGRALGGGSSVNCMKTIYVVHILKLKFYQFLYTRGRPLPITTIGERYMGTKDGILSIWYPFSKKLRVLQSAYFRTN